jgi:ATP-dependent RNA helicase DDX1
MLGGLLSMDERRRNLQLFKDGDIRILICTDVAARGIDISGLPFVINMTLPDEAEDYVHRIGRVGRSDRMGLAISLVATDNNEKVWYHKCNRKGGIGCFNRDLVEKKGCTIWYNESLQLNKIEQKLSSSILKMTQSVDATTGRVQWALPTQIADLKCLYGEVANASFLHPVCDTFMTEYLMDELKQLNALEIQSQNMYLRMHELFS